MNHCADVYGAVKICVWRLFNPEAAVFFVRKKLTGQWEITSISLPVSVSWVQT